MELEVRTKNGEIIAKYLGQMAVINFQILMNDTKLFEMVTKHIGVANGSPAKEFVCFVAIEYCTLNISDDFELWFAPGDYIKVNR